MLFIFYFLFLSIIFSLFLVPLGFTEGLIDPNSMNLLPIPLPTEGDSTSEGDAISIPLTIVSGQFFLIKKIIKHAHVGAIFKDARLSIFNVNRQKLKETLSK